MLSFYQLLHKKIPVVMLQGSALVFTPISLINGKDVYINNAKAINKGSLVSILIHQNDHQNQKSSYFLPYCFIQHKNK